MRTHVLGEADLIITMLCRSTGKLRAAAKGARGSKKRYPGGICPISAVACICDTPDDVNAVIQLDVDAQQEFYQLIAKAEARVQALASASQNTIYLAAAE